ncbi:hypothetical protein PIB30_079405 [Stylosanthes scabra]|uniref:Uncharacterized protein n=1 Tax=Stylosanthes scabra TaxID=79078 RepID=A0ABU6SRA1_9FABA|nr:hypothetical protein [Stylosanthes scabra]
MEKKQQQQQDEKKGEPKKVKVLSTSSLQINEEDASRLVGSIIEKGISDSQGNNIITTPPSSFPKPTVLPFPVARHRSHGPHWHPLSSKGGDGGNDDDYSDNDVEDKEDKIFKEFEKVSAFANPVQKRKKKGLDFKKWKEVTQDNYCPLEKESDDVINQATGKKKNEKGSKNADKKISPADGVALASMEVETKPQLNNSRGLLNSATPMEIDTSNKVDTPGRNKDATIYDSNVVNELMPERDHITNDKNPDHNFGSLDAIRAAQNNLTKNMVSSSSSSTTTTEQESMPLDDEIDAENRARIMQMSPEEIAEAQAEIMEKINPTLLKVLQKRGREKVKKQDGLKSEVGNSNASMNQNVHSHQDAKRLHMEDKISHMSMSQPLENKLDDEKNRATTVTTASGSSWNAWSSRVEAVRKLRFSLAGDPVDIDWASVYDDISERDYLRTEGDPGAAGYTIKEAVALTRSVVPGQRSLALHLLSSVLDKALQYICKDRTIHLSKSENEVDWEAVWAFALGPEPELALSLRMCLDDNHNSVVLACAKVVQSVLSCDVNDNYINISERDVVIVFRVADAEPIPQ